MFRRDIFFSHFRFFAFVHRFAVTGVSGNRRISRSSSSGEFRRSATVGASAKGLVFATWYSRAAISAGMARCVNAVGQFRGARRSKDFVEEDLQRRIGHGLQSQRRLTHFTHTLAERGGVLGAVVRVQREGHLEFVNRLRGQPCEEDFVQALEGAMIPLQPPHAFIDGKAGPLGVGERGEARERRQAMEWRVVRRAHGRKVTSRAGWHQRQVAPLSAAARKATIRCSDHGSTPRVRSRKPT